MTEDMSIGGLGDPGRGHEGLTWPAPTFNRVAEGAKSRGGRCPELGDVAYWFVDPSSR